MLLLAVTAACIPLGPNPYNFAPANTPNGASVRLLRPAVDSVVLAGELIAVTDSGLVVHDGTRLVHVPRARFARVEVKQMRAVPVATDPAWAVGRQKLRLVSRYPQGLSPELAQRLLAVTGQANIADCCR